MKIKNQTSKERPNNPYEKVFDDANRSLKEFGDMEFLDDIPDDTENEHPSIPFPYGNNAPKPYNFNLK